MNIMLEGLKVGKWRDLTKEELSELNRLIEGKEA
jgi:16S rRNA U516 pseudouridylate synthase RsuA-like enzyme